MYFVETNTNIQNTSSGYTDCCNEIRGIQKISYATQLENYLSGLAKSKTEKYE